MGVWCQSSTLMLLLVMGGAIVKSSADTFDAAAAGGGGGANTSIVLLPSLLNQSFVFDGASSSDLARQFYQRYVRGDAAEPLSSLLAGVLPDAVKKRLSASASSSSSPPSTVFARLPGLLQRALVWDSGFVLDAKASKFVQIWTMSGRSMAEILVTQQEVATVTAAVSKTWQCTWTNCTQPNNVTAYKAFDCTCDDTVELLVKCAAASDVNVDDGDSQDSDTQSSLLWATGADPSAIPVPSISEYQCQGAQDTGASNKTQQSELLSIHTALRDYRSCSTTRFDSLVIPCLRMNSSSASTNARLASMKEPKLSAWVDTWLESAIALQLQSQPPRTSDSANSSNASSSLTNSTLAPEIQEPSPSSFKMVLLLPIVLGSLVVIALIGFFLIRRTGSNSNRDAQRGVTTNSSIDITALLSPNSKDFL